MSDLGPSDLVHCPQCGRDLPASEFHRNRRRPNGLAYYCKTCARQRMEVSRRKRGIAARRAAQVDVPAGMKWCPDCDQIKPIVDFARTKASSSGIHSYCKLCATANVVARRCNGSTAARGSTTCGGGTGSGRSSSTRSWPVRAGSARSAARPTLSTSTTITCSVMYVAFSASTATVAWDSSRTTCRT